MAAYDYEGIKFGVGIYLNNLQKVSDGDSLTGRTTAEDDFAPIEAASAEKLFE